MKGSDTEVFSQVEKMSKSKRNTVDPLEIVADFGADTLRMYELFMGPLEQVKPWQTSGCKGVRNFLNKTWRLFIGEDEAMRPFGEAREDVTRALHVAIKETTEGIEGLKFNTPISKMMEFVNACSNTMPPKKRCLRSFELAPYAPHIAEELWEKLGKL